MVSIHSWSFVNTLYYFLGLFSESQRHILGLRSIVYPSDSSQPLLVTDLWDSRPRIGIAELFKVAKHRCTDIDYFW